MNWDYINGVAGIISLVMLLAHAAYTYLRDKDKVTTVRLAKMESDLTSKVEHHAERLSRVEAEAGKQPTHRDIAALYESINTLANTVNQLVGETKVQSDLLRMLINREVNKANR